MNNNNDDNATIYFTRVITSSKQPNDYLTLDHLWMCSATDIWHV